MNAKGWLKGCLVALALGVTPAGQAENLSLDPSVTGKLVRDGEACEMETKLLVQARKRAPQGTAPAAKRGGHLVKILGIDLRRGLVTGQVLATGEVVQVKMSVSTIKKRRIRSGQTLGIGPLAAGAKGRCKCGQKQDGSCWCTGEQPCCGPQAGCPIASCGKKQPIPNIKPEIMAP